MVTHPPQLPPEDEDYCAGQSCSTYVSRGLDALAGRWTVDVLEKLLFAGGNLRFGELQVRIPGISAKELARHLDHLTSERVVGRTRDGRNVLYTLTADGRKLMKAMEALGNWGKPREALKPPSSWGASLLSPN